jgi:hypothetical protein
MDRNRQLLDEILATLDGPEPVAAIEAAWDEIGPLILPSLLWWMERRPEGAVTDRFLGAGNRSVQSLPWCQQKGFLARGASELTGWYAGTQDSHERPSTRSLSAWSCAIHSCAAASVSKPSMV